MELMTLTEMVKTVPMTELCKGTKLDASTQQAIFDWFQFRRVSDNIRFPVYFNRLAGLVDDQYIQLLRVNLTEFDPMVSEYLERQITRDTEDKVTGSKTSSTSGTNSEATDTSSEGTNEQTFETGRTEKADGTTSGNTSGTEKVDGSTSGSTSGTSKTTESGTDDTSYDTSRTENTTGGSTSDSTTTDKQTTAGGSGTHTVQSQISLQGSTPDSSVYPATGFPTGLNWQYVSAQGETKNVSDVQEEHQETVDDTTTNKTTGSTTGETKNTGHDDTMLTHDLTVNGTTSSTSSETREDSKTTTGTSSETREDSKTMSGTDTTTGTTGVKGTSSTSGEHKSSTEETNGLDKTHSADIKERSTGRHEAPQDMMDRAVSFIKRTNAFLWLIEQLDRAFLAIYDWEDM